MSEGKVRRRPCENCGEPFTVRRDGQRFCTRGTCRQRAWDKAHPRVPIVGEFPAVRITLYVDLAAGITRIESTEVVEP